MMSPTACCPQPQEAYAGPAYASSRRLSFSTPTLRRSCEGHRLYLPLSDGSAAGHVLKLGFSLVSDLDRLAESYPWMTQFPGCLMTNQSCAQASSQHSQPFCSSEEFGTLRGEAETLTGEVASTSQSHREAYLAKILASDRRIRGARCCLDLATVAQAASGTLRQARRSAWALRLRQSDSRAAGGAWLDPAAASSLSGLTNAVSNSTRVAYRCSAFLTAACAQLAQTRACKY